MIKLRLPYLKDPKTQKRSTTITGWFISFNLVIATFICLLTKQIEDVSIVWAAIGFNAMYLAALINKRIRLGKDGVDFGNDTQLSEN